jgi:hypothetical protein
LANEVACADGSVWTDAKITNIKVVTSAPTAPKGYVLVAFATNGTGTPNCASGYPRNIAIDLSSQGGALAFAVLEKAVFGLPLTVTVRGTGACSVVSNADTLASLEEAVNNR